jgi:4-carboxymuconolactone decarboxylase
MTVRIAPLSPENRDPKTAELLAGLPKLPNGQDLTMFQTLAHHPRLLKRWSAFGAIFMGCGTLLDRDRELLILRTASNCGAAYEWGHHERWARQIGLTEAELAGLKEPVGSKEWSTWDALLLTAADELHDHSTIGDKTWSALAERLSEQQLIELCMLVGQYHLASFTANSLGVAFEGDG